LHVNHHLSPHADRWQENCRRVCEAQGVAFVARRVAVETTGEGVEQAARRARYRCFEQQLREGDILLMAHHRDDQVETVLYRLLRGAGPRGLAGMPGERALGAGTLLRPLLGLERRDLEDRARARGLDWVEDESNASSAFDRNFLRHRVLPVLAQRWPDYRRRMLRTAAECADAQTLLAERAAEDLRALGETPRRLGWGFALEGFRSLSRERRGNVLRHWVEQRLGDHPGYRVLDAVQHDLLPARGDAQPRVAWHGGEFRRFDDALYLLPNMPPPPDTDCLLIWDGQSPLNLPDGGRLTAQTASGRGVRIPRQGSLQIRFRQGGERCRPVGRPGSAPFKKLAREYGLPPWLRDRVPFIYVDDQLAAVGDCFVCESFAVGPGES
ncbi:MAG: tRNA lysidine(34) synthetase TilS, partial [Gammaproteobacteria bacterium]|nr:tRNA lysidine(34) synthetase TilS [Gammaproteobacteria bacterium]NIT64580.1 tRNA lysidine(34) synthetase TilS [Gammaproteobacteria bacterium]NIV21539.1 tRNA lysidine(34) synthetase TilS [Gammaproteobacteria bacterium]NIY33160.1 tRNA lysidine(34) synthetase TilS [Gammaproteobacteria bacterium]